VTWAELEAAEVRAGRRPIVRWALVGAASVVVVVSATSVTLRALARHRPIVFSGQLIRPAVGRVRATWAKGARADVYLNPVDLGPPHLLGSATADGRGSFTVRADPPADLGRYLNAAAGGRIDATVIYSDPRTRAAGTGAEQFRWLRASHQWRRVTIGQVDGAIRSVATVVLPPPGTIHLPSTGCRPLPYLLPAWMQATVGSAQTRVRRAARCR
jgi:hypothetical protein